ncbi:uncharacterized protein LOC117830741 [Notolabrus celidotus]|uniref:uncharacterized protein LOC117830741 n=1 Tax=Notolabrus celidotus TaxID=1203425 RepID=UPI001490722A|nr:uncharacterized protein LOC117830741 [Notolabrus celidotus]
MSSARPPVEEENLRTKEGRIRSFMAGLFQRSPAESPPTDTALPDHQEEEEELVVVRPDDVDEPPAAPSSDSESEPSDGYYPDPDRVYEVVSEDSDEESDCRGWYEGLIPPGFDLAGPLLIPENTNLNPADPEFQFFFEGVIDTLDSLEDHVYPLDSNSSSWETIEEEDIVGDVEDEGVVLDPTGPFNDPTSSYFGMDPSVVTPFLDNLLDIHRQWYSSSSSSSEEYEDYEDSYSFYYSYPLEVMEDPFERMESFRGFEEYENSYSFADPWEVMEDPFEHMGSSRGSEEYEDQVLSSSEGSSSSRRRGREESDDEADDEVGEPASKRGRWSSSEGSSSSRRRGREESDYEADDEAGEPASKRGRWCSSEGSSSSRRRGREESDYEGDDEADEPASKRRRWFDESDSD